MKMKTISIETFRALDYFVYCYYEQLGLTAQRKDLLDDISEGIKFTTMASQKVFLERLLVSKGVMTAEIITLAKKVYLSESSVVKEEKEIVRKRIVKKEGDLKRKKYEWKRASERAEWGMGA